MLHRSMYIKLQTANAAQTLLDALSVFASAGVNFHTITLRHKNGHAGQAQQHGQGGLEDLRSQVFLLQATQVQSILTITVADDDDEAMTMTTMRVPAAILIDTQSSGIFGYD